MLARKMKWPSVILIYGGHFFFSIIVNVATLRLKGLATKSDFSCYFTTKGAVTPPDKGAI